MKPATIATSGHDEKTGHPSSPIGPPTPMTPGTAAELAHELKKEFNVANEHWKTVNTKIFELIQVEEKEKEVLSAEVSRLREDRQKMKEYVVSVENELGKVRKYVGDGNKKFYPEE